MPEARVIVVDDHAVVRDGVCRLLADAGELVVAGAVGGVEEARAALDTCAADLLVLDLNLGGRSGLALLRDATVPALVLTMHDDAGTLVTALDMGARGYVLKGSGADTLLAGVRAVLAGERYIDPAMRGLSGSRAPIEALTPREQTVLELVADGMTSREIAERLGLSPKTVRNYRERLLAKVGVTTTAALVRAAMRLGWLQ